MEYVSLKKKEMKRLKKIFNLKVPGLILVLILLSCENSIIEESQIENFTNPYDFVGVMHNEGLTYNLRNIAELKGKNIEIQDLCNLTTSFLKTNKDYHFIIKDDIKFKDFQTMVIDNLTANPKQIDTLSIFISGTASNKYLNKLDKIIDEIDLIDTITTFKALKKLENEIWKSNISDFDKTGLLIMSSVGGHSFSFWKTNLSKYCEDQSKSNNSIMKVDLIPILKADMLGGFLGFVAGAITGAIGGTLIMPGVGSITAAVLEGMQAAVWGAVVASIWEVFYKYLLPALKKSEIPHISLNNGSFGFFEYQRNVYSTCFKSNYLFNNNYL